MIVKAGLFGDVFDRTLRLPNHQHGGLQSLLQVVLIGTAALPLFEPVAQGGVQYKSGRCRVEDNIFQMLRHAMLLQAGANGNVCGYNYSRENYWNNSESDGLRNHAECGRGVDRRDERQAGDIRDREVIRIPHHAPPMPPVPGQHPMLPLRSRFLRPGDPTTGGCSWAGQAMAE